MRDVFSALFELQREYLEHVRQTLGSDSAHPKQGPILALLLAMDGVSQADLMRSLGVSAATVAVSISRLERLGYVRRERNQRNQRANVLALTDAGREQAQKLQAAMREACQLALDNISQAEMAAFSATLDHMAANLRRYGQAHESTADGR